MMTEDRPVAFVVMPFADEFAAGLRDVIEPAVAEAGMTCVRGDQDPGGHIPSQIFERIFDSAAVVADISGANPNVFYELAIAHGVGKRTVTVVREDWADRIPFDITSYRALVYPKPPPDPAHDERAAYHVRSAEARRQLADWLRRLEEEGAKGIPNPVQDFLAARSPLTSAGSLYLPRFEAGQEEEMLRRVAAELVCVALTGSSFIRLLAGYLESGERKRPLALRLLLLDPRSREGWSYIYHLREGRPVTEREYEELLAEDRASQARTERDIERLNGQPGFTAEILYYSGIPLFWAYLIDRRRLIVGHLAMEKLGALNLPVSVIVRGDPTTETLYSYYASAIDSLIASTRGEEALT